MMKIETIYHYLLYSALQEKRFSFTQQELAKSFDYSLSTISHALKIPEELGAIKKTSKFFVLQDFKKLLYYWATVRRFKKDIIYQTYIDAPVVEIEGLVPAGTIYACYSAGRRILEDAPADYAKVYFYFDKEKVEIVKNRFPEVNNREANLFVIAKSFDMDKYGLITTIPQTFVDIWGLSDWYGRDFILALEEKIDGLL
ncbi:winged helix-turn-helix domain-containing protein [Candidatus Gottesmanbacteria bacterium]|nr:winged helix-turn-helix domain-containing protein [Candidatus Gottesmanbacteria bacterium]